MPRLHFLPGDVEGLQDAFDRAFQRLVEHLLVVDLELRGHLVVVFEADDVLIPFELFVDVVFGWVESFFGFDTLEERVVNAL